MKSLSLAATAALAVAAPAAAEKTVVTADRDLDVATGRYVEQPAILVGDDGRITAIADARRNSVTRSAASATKDVGAIAVGWFGDMARNRRRGRQGRQTGRSCARRGGSAMRPR